VVIGEKTNRKEGRMNYLVNISTDPKAEIGHAWAPITAETHQEAAIEALKQGIEIYAPLVCVWARVHGESDPKHPNGSPALIHTFELRIN
jgi:hypothetical protein